MTIKAPGSWNIHKMQNLSATFLFEYICIGIQKGFCFSVLGKERLGPSCAGFINMIQGKVYLVGAEPDLVKKVGEFVGELKEVTKTGY